MMAALDDRDVGQPVDTGILAGPLGSLGRRRRPTGALPSRWQFCLCLPAALDDRHKAREEIVGHLAGGESISRLPIWASLPPTCASTS